MRRNRHKKRHRKTHHLKRLRRLATLMAVIAVASFAGGRHVSAAFDTSTADSMIDDYMSVVDIDDISERLRETLRERLNMALQIGVIDESEMEALGYASDVSPPSTLRDRDRLQLRLTDQMGRWEIIGPDWKDAFERVRDRFRACSDDPTTACTEENRLLLQLRHAEQVELSFQQRLSEANGDSEREQELLRIRERAMNQLTLMLRNGDAEVLETFGVTVQEMTQLQKRLQTKVASGVQSSTTVQPSQNTTQKGKP